MVILGQDNQEHLSNISQVLQWLHEASLKIKLSKCELFKKKVYFYGHIISEDCIIPDLAKTDIVASWSTPTTCWQVQQFIGLANYYHKEFHYCGQTSPEKNGTFKCQQAFNNNKLTSPLSLHSLLLKGTLTVGKTTLGLFGWLLTPVSTPQLVSCSEGGTSDN